MRILLLISFCVFQIPAAAIMNGHTVDENSLLAAVSVKLTARAVARDYSDCSGTRIARKYILTAAHCVRVSRFATLAGGRVYPVKQSWTHPRWNDNTDAYDLAILALEENVPAGRVAGLPGVSERLRVGDVLTMAGFGYTETGTDGILHRTENAVINPRYGRSVIAVLGDRTGMCGGDSGGGNFLEAGGSLTVVGVNSFTEEDDRYGCDDRGFLANVAVARRWIDSILSK